MSKVDVEFSLREFILYCTLRGEVDIAAETILLQHRDDVKRADRAVIDVRHTVFVDSSVLKIAERLQELTGADYVDFVASPNSPGLRLLEYLRSGGFLVRHIVYDDVDQVTRYK
jgi:hypothetical protein